MTSSRTVADLARISVLAALYFATAKLGLMLAFVHASATAIWPPTGIAAAALLVLGPRLWPGVFLGAFLANITTQSSILTVLGIATGNTLEGVLGAYLVRRFANGRNAFRHPRDVFRFAVLAGLLSTTVSATLGVTSLSLASSARWADYSSIWWTWWLGDAMGDLLVAPPLVLWMLDARIWWTRTQMLELALWLLLAFGIGQIVFGPLFGIGVRGYPIEFLYVPLLVWIAFRFGPRKTATGALVLAGVALWGTLRGYGPFAREAPNNALLLLQAFMGVSAITALALAAAVSERTRARQALLQSEALLRQSEKMEAIGRLAGGVAHDFNNILTAILGFTELLLRETDEGHPLRPYMEEIRQAGRRAATLTRQLLAFGRKQMLRPAVLNLNTLLAEMQPALKSLVGKHVELAMILDPGLGNVSVERAQIEQVLLNLVSNACDAMSGGGRLTLETANADVEPGPAEPDAAWPTGLAERDAGWPAGRYVVLTIRDTGVGMAAETMAHLFEPFFTTKEPGQGTGMGLATVYGIVHQSNGQIRVESTPGAGTTFRIRLPRVAEAPAPEAPPVAVASAGDSHATILLVEDEDAVRRMIRVVLAKTGYTVLEARDAMAALQICARPEQRIDLLLTDVVMPHMNGRELADRVVRMRPGLRVLFMSGYARDAIVRDGLLEPGIEFMAKPVTPQELIRKVGEVLAAPGGQGRAAPAGMS
jgi:signal transduction histidine kinase/CheY-like chemotaxis protein